LLTLSGTASGSGTVEGEHRRNLVLVFSKMKRCKNVNKNFWFVFLEIYTFDSAGSVGFTGV
jgi:hypothetical protein